MLNYVPSLELELAFAKYLEEEEIRKFGERLRGKKEDAKLDELKYGDMFDRYLYKRTKRKKEIEATDVKTGVNTYDDTLGKVANNVANSVIASNPLNFLSDLYSSFSEPSKDTSEVQRRAFVNAFKH